MSSLVLSWSEWPSGPSSFILRGWGLCYNGLLGAPDHVSLGHAQVVRHLPYGSANWETDRCKRVTLQVHLACLRPNTDRMVQVIPSWPSRCFLRLTWFKAEGRWCHKGIRWNPEGNQTTHPAAKESLCPQAKFQTLPKPFWNNSRKGNLATEDCRRLQMMPALHGAFSLKSALIQLAWASKRAEDGNSLAVGLNALFQSTGWTVELPKRGWTCDLRFQKLRHDFQGYRLNKDLNFVPLLPI